MQHINYFFGSFLCCYCKTITFKGDWKQNYGDAIITSIFKIIASSMTIVPTSISEIPTCIQRQSFMYWNYCEDKVIWINACLLHVCRTLSNQSIEYKCASWELEHLTGSGKNDTVVNVLIIRTFKGNKTGVWVIRNCSYRG